MREETWEGTPSYDVFSVDVKTGARTDCSRASGGARASLPPDGSSRGMTRKRRTGSLFRSRRKFPVNMTAGVKVPLFDELRRRSGGPRGVRRARLDGRDSLFFVYDRYDIWGVDPTGTKECALHDGR